MLGLLFIIAALVAVLVLVIWRGVGRGDPRDRALAPPDRIAHYRLHR